MEPFTIVWPISFQAITRTAAQFHSGVVDFVAVKSTQNPQDSIGDGLFAPSRSIETSYSLLISIGFNNSFDPFWEQRVGGSNPSAPTIIFFNA